MQFDDAVESLLAEIGDRGDYIKKAVAEKLIREGKLFWEKSSSDDGYYSVKASQQVRSKADVEYTIENYWEISTKKGYRDRSYPYARICFEWISYDQDIYIGDEEAESGNPLTTQEAYNLSRNFLLVLSKQLKQLADACPHSDLNKN